jgi:hypothetical protein
MGFILRGPSISDFGCMISAICRQLTSEIRNILRGPFFRLKIKAFTLNAIDNYSHYEMEHGFDGLNKFSQIFCHSEE